YLLTTISTAIGSSPRTMPHASRSTSLTASREARSSKFATHKTHDSFVAWPPPMAVSLRLTDQEFINESSEAASQEIGSMASGMFSESAHGEPQAYRSGRRHRRSAPRTTLKASKVIAVGDAHGAKPPTIPDPERVKQNMVRPLQGRNNSNGAIPGALPPAIESQPCRLLAAHHSSPITHHSQSGRIRLASLLALGALLVALGALPFAGRATGISSTSYQLFSNVYAKVFGSGTARTVIPLEPFAGTTYYSQASGDPATLTNWNSVRGGGGTAPANFTSGDTFVIQNGHNISTASSWALSGTGNKIQIESGGTLTANNLV